MEGALKVGFFGPRCSELAWPPSSPFHRRTIHGLPKRWSLSAAVSRAGSEVIGEDIMQTFLKDREVNGDFISKVTDMIWRRDELRPDNPESSFSRENLPNLDEVSKDEDAGGFLKLTKTRAWVYGENIGPSNTRLAVKERQNDAEKRKKLNLLKYEALKRELLFLTTGIGAACSVYCLIGLSLEAALSYAAGVLFRQLLVSSASVLSRRQPVR